MRTYKLHATIHTDEYDSRETVQSKRTSHSRTIMFFRANTPETETLEALLAASFLNRKSLQVHQLYAVESPGPKNDG